MPREISDQRTDFVIQGIIIITSACRSVVKL